MDQGILEFMQNKSTEELKQILSEKNKTLYKDETFDIIRHILVLRNEIIEDSKEIEKEQNDDDDKSNTVNKKYATLRLISFYLKVVGILIVVLGFIALIVIGYSSNWLIGFGVLLLAVLFSLAYFAISEIINLFIDIEYNTRVTSTGISKIISK
ncbi:MAG: hypothetical protein U5N26_07145 [Candidatus Marinimicrobia bacterium]|nr:hypothetical protein [Candidatus Neomarinimicrobiota bacterium]